MAEICLEEVARRGAARFVAGQGAMAERLQRGGAMAELLLAGAPRSAERKEGRCVGDPARGGPSVGEGGPVPNR